MKKISTESEEETLRNEKEALEAERWTNNEQVNFVVTGSTQKTKIRLFDIWYDRKPRKLICTTIFEIKNVVIFYLQILYSHIEL